MPQAKLRLQYVLQPLRIHPAMADATWILLLYELPTKQGSQRVNLWRKLKKIGAVSLKTSAYLLPDTAAHHEHLQWLAQQVRDAGGDATLIRVTEIEGMAEADLVRLFNDARAQEYAELSEPLNDLLKRNKKRFTEGFSEELLKLGARFEEIRHTDFFECPKAAELQALLSTASALRDGKSPMSKLAAKEFSGRKWLTRPRPEIDRVGSAWLIHKFIDPKARFVFATDRRKHPNALPFDMLDAEFTHHGEDCTFETLVKRFGITDKAVQKIAEMVHDADLEDGKFRRLEGLGIQHTLRGWAALGLSDNEIVTKGCESFDAIYAIWRKQK